VTVVLAIESATSAVGVALLRGDEVTARTIPETRRHTEHVLDLVAGVLAEGACSLDDLDGIAVDVGPGLFTGMRVGISTAVGLAMALNRPVVALSSLEVVAEALPGAERVALVDGRRGEVFLQRFVGHGRDLAPLSDPAVVTVDEVVGRLGSGAVIGGDGVARVAAHLASARPDVTVVEAVTTPPVDHLARLGACRLEAGLGLDPAAVAPIYLRDADAKVNFAVRGRS
jgi:tRNA threonylcarbamoyladenosine biosynthesis protein TsaB